MRKIAIIVIAILLITSALLLNHKPVKHTTVAKKPIATPVQVTHGVKPPYNDCVPNSFSTKAKQQEIIDTAKAMQQEEKVTNGQISTGLTALDQKYNDLIARYDTCTEVDN